MTGAGAFYDKFANDNPAEMLSNPSKFATDEQAAFKKQYAQELKSPEALTWGAAMCLTSPGGQYNSLQWNGGEAWLTGNIYPSWDGIPLQFIGSGTFRGGQLEETKGVVAHQQSGNVGIQMKIVTGASFDCYGQFSEQRKWITGGDDGSRPVYSAGIEVKLPTWLGSNWLQLGWSSAGLSTGHSVFGTSIRWQSAAGPVIK